MNYDNFLEIVRQEAGIEPEQAEQVSCFTLNLLAQRISKGEAEDIADRLPESLRPCTEHRGPRATFHADEMLQRIERVLHSDRTTAERVARAVLAAVCVSAGPKEYADIRAELPGDFMSLLDSAEVTAARLRTRLSPFVGELSVDEFVGRVAERAGLTPDLARKATEAVLEVLAMRIADGQVEDLKPFVPPELHDALNLGELRSGGRALRMPVEQFLDEIARREGEGVTREQAARHARAVFAVLHEAVGEKEFSDTIAQLPRDYSPLIDAARTGTGVDVGGAPGGTVAAATGAPSQPPDFIGHLSADEFVERVAERAHLDPGRAARATDAVLEALALRITAGEVEDLKPFIPPELRGPLDRGVERSRGRARRMGLQHFLDEIAVQEGPGVTEEEAASHARVVFQVLYEVVGKKEFRDTIAQLPAEYDRIIPQATKLRH